jgi:hypothetical protein
MPDPALPYDTPTEAAEIRPNYTREFFDLQGRAYTGTVTLTQPDPPKFSAELTIQSGRVRANVPAGLYNMKAMLRDPDGVRAFICEDINVVVQEDS